MPEVNEQIAKDFFETQGFVVSTNVAFPVVTKKIHQYSDFDLVIRNTRKVKPDKNIPFVLDRDTVKSIEAAVVEVKGWHGDPLVPSYLKKGSETRRSILGFVGSDAKKAAPKASGVQQPKYILVVSELARTEPAKLKVMQMLESEGISHMITFEEILESLANSIEVNRHYAHSPTLHLLRLLKNYKMLR